MIGCPYLKKNFVATAKYLNINQLSEAVPSDTHYGHIYDKCVQQSKCYVEDRTYFIFAKLSPSFKSTLAWRLS